MDSNSIRHWISLSKGMGIECLEVGGLAQGTCVAGTTGTSGPRDEAHQPLPVTERVEWLTALDS